MIREKHKMSFSLSLLKKWNLSAKPFHTHKSSEEQFHLWILLTIRRKNNTNHSETLEETVKEGAFINLFHEISIKLKTKPGKDVTQKVSSTPNSTHKQRQRSLYKEIAILNPKYMRRLESIECIPTMRDQSIFSSN